MVGRYFQLYLHFNNCAEWSIFSIMVTYYCSEITQLHERLDELQRQLRKTQMKLIYLNSFGWTVLHVLSVHSYTLCTGRHFKPAQSLYMELLLYSVIMHKRIMHTVHYLYENIYAVKIFWYVWSYQTVCIYMPSYELLVKILRQCSKNLF